MAAVVNSTDDAIISKDLDGSITSWNRGAERIFGWTAAEMIGSSIFKLIPADRLSEEKQIIATIREGRRVETYDTVRMKKGGGTVPVSITVSPVFDMEGNIIGASKVARDITDRMKSEEIRHLLMREVAHRSKNMLAIVEAIVRQTASRSPPADFAERLSQRLRSIAVSQDLLVNGEWSGVEITALVDGQLAHVDLPLGPRIQIAGPSLILKPAAAQTLGMALHELATNALEHGSLSNDRGHVELSWTLDDATFDMQWIEFGGPPITQQPVAGFGETVLRRTTEGSLQGHAEHLYAPSGLRWRLRAPRNMVLA
ncbi:MAG TPA: PAS domain S-box protein [Arsenicitalea sp.]|nr:PAS domain S-box protein [Arsenicitalea sp.]